MNNRHIRTYRQLAESLRTLLDRQGFPSNSNRYSLKLIYHTLLDMRSSYMRRNKVARQGIGEQNVQTIPCVLMEDADQNICPCAPPSGCKWLRSKETIPKTIALTSVTNTIANFKADYVEWNQFKHKLNSRSVDTKKSRFYTFLDTGDGSYLYLYNDSYLKNVSISGLFENPNHAATYPNCGEETPTQKHLICNPLDTPLLMDGDQIDVIFKLTFDFLSRTNQASTIDTKNDSQPEDVITAR